MADLWPWIAVAGLGALHGLSPANGWMFAAAWGVHSGKLAQVRHALLPIAIGHAASIAAVACAFAQGLSMDRAWAQDLAGALLLGAAAYRVLRHARHGQPINAKAGHAGIALWSFLMATAHGAGLMLLPALALCIADSPAREIAMSGSLLLALAAVGVHRLRCWSRPASLPRACAAVSPCISACYTARRRATAGPPHWPSLACC